MIYQKKTCDKHLIKAREAGDAVASAMQRNAEQVLCSRSSS